MEGKRYVLFSPIGDVDPITMYRDGSMLHIARHYRPECVYLYLTKQKVDCDDKDNRYEEALKLLAKELGVEIRVVKLRHPERVDVQLFDEFYYDFEDTIRQIRKEYPDAGILLNVSSGTPAMKAALHTIAALTDVGGCTAIQVETPDKSRHVTEFDLEYEWCCNEDNAPESKKRCFESKHTNFLLKIRKEIICSLIDAYDYRAALELARKCGGGVSETAKIYLRAACARSLLNEEGVDEQLKRSGADAETRACFTPQTGKRRSSAEYLLWLEIKLKRSEYCDFIRGISPVFLDLLEDVCGTCGIPLPDFCLTQGGKRVLSHDKMSRTEEGRRALRALGNAFRSYGGFLSGDLSASRLVPLIEEFSGNAKLKEIIKNLRLAEQNCRNIAAHEVVSVTDKWIKEHCGLEPEQILARLKDLAEFTGLERSVIHDSYKKMNRLIIESL